MDERQARAAREFEDKVRRRLAACDMLQSGQTVTVACSGGADSVALLCCMQRLADELGVRVQAAHVDHGLRPESGEEAAFVARLCRARGLRFVLFDAKKEGYAPPESGVEEWARELRYGFLSRVAGETGGPVATAHTADDQAETLLFRLARGASLRSAGGIPPVRGAFIRPLLDIERSEVEAYCAALGQEYVTDGSNLSDGYARNRLRHYAVPALRAANAAAVRNMAAWCGEMRELDAYLDGQAEMLLEQAAAPNGWRAGVIAAAPRPVRRAALAMLARPAAEPDRRKFELLEALAAGEGRAVQLADGWRMVRRRGLLTLENEPKEEPAQWEMPLREGEICLPGGFCMAVRRENAKNRDFSSQVHKKALTYAADCDKIPFDTVIRCMRPGDRFRPAGRGVSKPLRKFFWEEAVPAAMRPRLPVLAAGSRVLWVWGFGFADGIACEGECWTLECTGKTCDD